MNQEKARKIILKQGIWKALCESTRAMTLHWMRLENTACFLVWQSMMEIYGSPISQRKKCPEDQKLGSRSVVAVMKIEMDDEQGEIIKNLCPNYLSSRLSSPGQLSSRLSSPEQNKYPGKLLDV